MLEHGGRLLAAAREHGIALERWLDLSTGINPNAWPVPGLSSRHWSRLPEDDDGLVESACRYYRAPSVLPVAGSQAAIQTLPRLRPPCRVGIASPTYAEHAQAWETAGHRVDTWTRRQGVEDMDVLVLVNPNNPTGEFFSIETLLQFHRRLAEKGGWLIVDEAFVDATPEYSLASHTHLQGLIVLRSFGKFFGLPGARVGFVLAQPRVLHDLQEMLGPWPLTGPSRWVAQQALADTTWHAEQRNHLITSSQQLIAILRAHGLEPDGGTALFQWVTAAHAAAIHRQLARQAVFTRFFAKPASLRFGLPGTEADWQRLADALARLAL